MLRCLFTLVSAASLVLCAATCVLWVRSRTTADQPSAAVVGHRYTLRSARGVLTLVGPPRPTGAEPDRRAAAALLADVRDDRLTWQAWPSSDALPPGHALSFRAIPESPLGTRLVGLLMDREGYGSPPAVQPPDVARSLLAALEDPGRALAAHLTLEVLYGRPWKDAVWLATLGVQTGSTQSELFPRVAWSDPPRAGRAALGVVPVAVAATGPPGARGRIPCAVRADAAGLAAARDRWHAAFDVPVASAPHWAVAAGSAALPAGWAGRWVVARLRGRSRRRRLAGLCPACGYDLRATPGRCPECGRAAAA